MKLCSQSQRTSSAFGSIERAPIRIALGIQFTIADGEQHHLQSGPHHPTGITPVEREKRAREALEQLVKRKAREADRSEEQIREELGSLPTRVRLNFSLSSIARSDSRFSSFGSSFFAFACCSALISRRMPFHTRL